VDTSRLVWRYHHTETDNPLCASAGQPEPRPSRAHSLPSDARRAHWRGRPAPSTYPDACTTDASPLTGHLALTVAPRAPLLVPPLRPDRFSPPTVRDHGPARARATVDKAPIHTKLVGQSCRGDSRVAVRRP
jgi:hypothetical protein